MPGAIAMGDIAPANISRDTAVFHYRRIPDLADFTAGPPPAVCGPDKEEFTSRSSDIRETAGAGLAVAPHVTG